MLVAFVRIDFGTIWNQLELPLKPLIETGSSLKSVFAGVYLAGCWTVVAPPIDHTKLGPSSAAWAFLATYRGDTCRLITRDLFREDMKPRGD